MATGNKAFIPALLVLFLILFAAGCTSVPKEPSQLVPVNATNYYVLKPKLLAQDENLSAAIGLPPEMLSQNELAKFGIDALKIDTVVVFAGNETGYRGAIMKGGFESALILAAVSNHSFGNYTIEDFEGSPLIILKDRGVTVGVCSGNLVIGPDAAVRDVILVNVGKLGHFGNSYTSRALAGAGTTYAVLALSSTPKEMGAKATALSVSKKEDGLETKAVLVFETAAEAEIRKKDIGTALDFMRGDSTRKDAASLENITVSTEAEVLSITIKSKTFQEAQETLSILSSPY